MSTFGFRFVWKERYREVLASTGAYSKRGGILEEGRLFEPLNFLLTSYAVKKTTLSQNEARFHIRSFLLIQYSEINNSQDEVNKILFSSRENVNNNHKNK